MFVSVIIFLSPVCFLQCVFFIFSPVFFSSVFLHCFSPVCFPARQFTQFFPPGSASVKFCDHVFRCKLTLTQLPQLYFNFSPHTACAFFIDSIFITGGGLKRASIKSFEFLNKNHHKKANSFLQN